MNPPPENSSADPRHPGFRKLRGYAFDPSMSLQLDTVTINEVVYRVVWEDLWSPMGEDQGPGPIGEYVEVVDYDPTVQTLYSPVDLNHPFALAMDGLDPDEANPQFHQQMVYAVVMTTIRNFELGLGRKVLWAPRRMSTGPDKYVQRLRIYPHALREANAYYSPQKKALLFGYFQAMPADKTRHMPDSLVFTCLSHDIIAHETTHAILDGMYPYYNEPTNPDVLAFHEGFADIVALFQHFTFPEVLKHQIARTRGNLEGQNLLGQLAQEFGSAIGGYGSLRDAIGHNDRETGKWVPNVPNPADYESQVEPHARGSILVAAVFEAFLNIYKYQVADMLRIASDGSGILGEGALHPDLVNRLAAEASRCAERVLHMCIRALDYCPPVDLTFGDYLRGIITADIDLKGEEQHAFRLVFIEAFRRRGIYPKGIKTLSVGSIAYPNVPPNPRIAEHLTVLVNFLRDYRHEVQHETKRDRIFEFSREFTGGARGLHSRLLGKFEHSKEFQELTGLAWINWQDAGVASSRSGYGPRFTVQNLRLVSRTGPKGDRVNNIVFSIVQRAGVNVADEEVRTFVLPDPQPPKPPVSKASKKAAKNAAKKSAGNASDPPTVPADSMIFRGGCTFVFDLDELRLKYVISKPLVARNLEAGIARIDEERVLAQYEYQYETGPAAMSEFQAYFGSGFASAFSEPFALLHQH